MPNKLSFKGMETPQQNTTQPKEQNLKLFSVITGLFCATLLLSNITAVKLILLGPLTITGGTILFPIIFIFNDILTETYGYRLSRKVIWTGFACQLFAVVSYYVVGLMPAAPFWPNQDAYMQILGVVPRITLASVAAYFCGEFANSSVLSKMKYRESGKRGLRQAWRFIASTIVGEGVDSIIFMTVAFAGVLDPKNLLSGIISIYLLKVAYEVVATPFSTRFANWLKKYEGIDQIDRPEETDYNPFSVFRKGDA